MHMARHPLTDFERERARSWMRECRGDTSQVDLVDDIRQTITWGITRDRYSKYESGSVPFCREVLESFVTYWAKKGKPGPDFTPPAVDTPADPMADALKALAKELAELRLERTETIGRLEARLAKLEPLEPLVDGLVEQALAAERKRSAPGASAELGR